LFPPPHPPLENCPPHFVFFSFAFPTMALSVPFSSGRSYACSPLSLHTGVCCIFLLIFPPRGVKPSLTRPVTFFSPGQLRAPPTKNRSRPGLNRGWDSAYPCVPLAQLTKTTSNRVESEHSLEPEMVSSPSSPFSCGVTVPSTTGVFWTFVFFPLLFFPTARAHLWFSRAASSPITLC